MLGVRTGMRLNMKNPGFGGPVILAMWATGQEYQRRHANGDDVDLSCWDVVP